MPASARPEPVLARPVRGVGPGLVLARGGWREHRVQRTGRDPCRRPLSRADQCPGSHGDLRLPGRAVGPRGQVWEELRADLARITAPTLVITTTADQFVSPRLQRQLAVLATFFAAPQSAA